MREDTRPETPMAKSTSDPPPAPDGWRSPGQNGAPSLNDLPFGKMHGGAARFDFAMGNGKVRTFHAKGPAGVALAIALLGVVLALVAMFFVFAVGVGTALALGAGAVAAIGLGARAVRRRLTSTHHHELGSGDN
jgi:hypothetical protein